MSPQDLLRTLVEQDILGKEQAQQFSGAVEQGIEQLEQELQNQGVVTKKQILEAKSTYYGVPYLDMEGREVPPETLKEVPENTVRRYQFAPLKHEGDELVVGMVDPGDVDAREALKFVSVQEHVTPKIYLISREALEEIADQYSSLGKEVGKALQELEEELEKDQEEGVEEKEEEISAEAPVTRVVAVILRHAVEGGASDIHVEPLEEKTRVRFRVDGVLHSSIFLPKKIHPAIVARIKIISNLQIDEKRKPQDGRFQTKVKEKKIDFRVSVLPTAFGEKVVMRILDPSAGVGKLEDLGLIGRNLEEYREAVKKPFGLVLVTGPTGSGKSTTLYTTLTKVNSEEVNTVTLEDPVEYYIEGVNQSQIRPEIGFTFANGLRSILRQDPDIIMVGEIRDAETAELATHSALTGHLVFSTLHTNDALGIVPRLVNMGVEPYLLPPTLIAGVAQRLVRRLCSECKKEVKPTASQRKVIEDALTDVSKKDRSTYDIEEPYMLAEAEGCEACGDTGTQGRIGIFEIFKMTPELEEVVLSDISESKLAKEAKRQGMITLREDGILKALQGEVSLEEVLRVVEVEAEPATADEEEKEPEDTTQKEQPKKAQEEKEDTQEEEIGAKPKKEGPFDKN